MKLTQLSPIQIKRVQYQGELGITNCHYSALCSCGKTIFVRKEKVNAWFMPPFKEQEIWRCQFGKLDYLKREIPYPVVLQINELKKLKVFNCFNVLAPMEAWERKTDIDPIVVATVWEIPPNEKKDEPPNKAGQAAHFFLAQW